jgi:hypothetical protein
MGTGDEGPLFGDRNGAQKGPIVETFSAAGRKNMPLLCVGFALGQRKI